MEVETKATDDGRPLGRRMTSRVGAAAHAPIWSEQPLGEQQVRVLYEQQETPSLRFVHISHS